MAKRGRPQELTQPLTQKIIELFKAGKTEKEVANIIGFHVNTLYNWKLKNPEFMWSVKEAKDVADDLVEAALFTRAIGYSHKEVKIMSYEGESFEHEFINQVPPDTQAAQFWLKNRRPEKWREKSEIEVTAGTLADKLEKARKRIKK